MKCINHPEKDAISVCVSCGVGLCQDCRKVERGGPTFCEDCAREHEPARAFPGKSGDGVNVWAITAWVLAVVGLWPGLEFVAIGGIVLAFVALGDISLHNVAQSGKSYAYWALVVGGGGLAVKLLIVGYMLWTGIINSPFDAYKYVGL
jgi:hypothetical protein